MPPLTWAHTRGTTIHTADRGGLTILVTPGRRYRVYQNGTAASVAYSSLGMARAKAQELADAEPPVNRCPCSFPHPPHDYCDGTPVQDRQPADEIVLTNPPGGEQRPDPTPSGSGSPAPSTPTSESASPRTSSTPGTASVGAASSKPAQLPPFFLVRTPAVRQDGRPLKSWL